MIAWCLKTAEVWVVYTIGRTNESPFLSEVATRVMSFYSFTITILLYVRAPVHVVIPHHHVGNRRG
jgi:hypothetical protein